MNHSATLIFPIVLPLFTFNLNQLQPSINFFLRISMHSFQRKSDEEIAEMMAQKDKEAAEEAQRKHQEREERRRQQKERQMEQDQRRKEALLEEQKRKAREEYGDDGNDRNDEL